MLTDGVSGQEVPHSVSNGRQPFQALHIDQEAANTTANVLLTAGNRGEIPKPLSTKLSAIHVLMTDMIDYHVCKSLTQSLWLHILIMRHLCKMCDVVRTGGNRANIKNMSSVWIGRCLRINPLLQGVPKLLSLDWLSQGAQCGLELSDGGRQELEPAACTRLFLQYPPAFG